jgi:transposase
VGESHFHALWLLSCGYEVDEVAEILSFSPRWVRALLKRYSEGGAEALGDQRIYDGTKPTILTPEALAALKERMRRSTGPPAHRTREAKLLAIGRRPAKGSLRAKPRCPQNASRRHRTGPPHGA